MQRRTLEILDRQSWLDPISARLSSLVAPLLDPPPVRTLLSGSWLGHRLHPVLTDMAVGSLVSTTLLDLVAPDQRKAADRLALVGIASAGPTIASGLNDWYDVGGSAQPIRRVGLVHATANLVGLSLYLARGAARRAGNDGRGRLLSVLGLSVLGAGGYLGGHLTYMQGAGVDRTAFEVGPEEWTPALALSELPEDTPTHAEADGRPLLLVRRGDVVHALGDTCSHYGCLLSGGRLEAGAVVCPCHGSTFRIDDGSIVRGPAATPQPVFETRVTAGMVEVRGPE